MAQFVGAHQPFHFIGKIGVNEQETVVQDYLESAFLLLELRPFHNLDVKIGRKFIRVSGAILPNQMLGQGGCLFTYHNRNSPRTDSGIATGFGGDPIFLGRIFPVLFLGLPIGILKSLHHGFHVLFG